ncbi:S8 family serine peptidase [Paenibacillus sp. GSMTC-2017]|nr:S8 family serine peptidase [Paenibacillus sp. GSMTC-2017]
MKITRISKTMVLSLTAALAVSLWQPAASAAVTVTNAPPPPLFEFKKSIGQAEHKLNSSIISPSIDTSSSKIIHVLVQLTGEPLVVGQYAASQGLYAADEIASQKSLYANQQSVLGEALKRNIQLEVKRWFNTVLNGAEIAIPANQIPQLAKVPGVTAIVENRNYYLAPEPVADNNNTPIYDSAPLDLIGAPDAWAQGLTGKGLKIGVLDTGVDYIHPDLKNAYKGGYDSISNDDDPYEDFPIPNIAFVGTDHGTHVAGTIVGRSQNKTSEIVQKGVAYESDLYAYKVLGRDELNRVTGNSAQILEGIERAVKDGMDVLNLSLGSALNKNPHSLEAIAINNAVLGGTVVVVSSGNAADEPGEPYYYSIGTPSNAQLAITVGATSVATSVYQASANVSLPNLGPYPFLIEGFGTGKDDFQTIFGTAAHEVVYAGLGRESDYEGLNVEGKIVIVSRGILPFVQKEQYARLNKAKAIIIFNGNAKKENNIDVPDLSETIAGRDDHFNVYLGDSIGGIPILDMRGDEGRKLIREITAQPNQPFTLTFATEYAVAKHYTEDMGTFSSRGPTMDGRYLIKPDVTAPGVAIMSSISGFNQTEAYATAYGRKNGTSMAAPHVSGLALLLQQKYPDWSPFDIRAALANTAVDIYNANGTLYDVYSQGSGRTNITNALKTPALLQTVENIVIQDIELNDRTINYFGSNFSFGLMAPGDTAKSVALQLKNISDYEVTYSAKINLQANVTSDPLNPIETPDVSQIEVALSGLDANRKLTASAKSAHSFTLELAPKATAQPGVYEGEVLLESPGHPTLQLPFVVHVGTEAPASDFILQDSKIAPNKITPNGDGVNDTGTLTVTYNKPIPVEKQATGLAFLVYDRNDKYLGVLGGYENSNQLPLDTDTFEIRGLLNGQYFVVNESGESVKKTLAEGTYSVETVAYNITQATGQLNKVAYSYASFHVSYPVVTPTNPTGPSVSVPSAPAPSPQPTGDTPALKAVVDQGQAQKPIKTEAQTNGNTVKVTVNTNDLKSIILPNSSVAVIVSSSPGEGQQSKLELSEEQVEALATAASGSSIIFNTGEASISLPTELLKNAPKGAALHVIIGAAATKSALFDNQDPSSKLHGVPVQFEAIYITESGEQPVKTDGTLIKRAFTVKSTEDLSSAGVLFHTNGKVAAAPSKFVRVDDLTWTVIVSRPGFSEYTAITRTVNFTDLSHSWASNEIEKLANKFLLNGTTATTFSPKQSITRAEFTAILVRALGLSGSGETSFTDVNSTDWFAADVSAAFEAGLIKGTGNGLFQPHAKISRQDFAIMLDKATQLLRITTKTLPGNEPYKDHELISDYAKDSVERLSGLGLIQGSDAKGAKIFNPLLPTTREATAKVIHRLLQLGGLI